MVQRKLPRFTYNSVRYGNQRSDRRAIEIFGNGIYLGRQRGQETFKFFIL